jgi:hypothetical protein
MSKILIGLFGCFVFIGGKACYAQTSWENSPYNWKNSEYNYNNSSMNYNNSPYNYNNSPYNYNSPNGVYDNNGNRQGYIAPNPSGVVNIYDNNGNRRGYIPTPYGR